jgi:hypothetical protein
MPGRVAELRLATKQVNALLAKIPKTLGPVAQDLYSAQRLLNDALQVAENSLAGADGDLVREAHGLRDEALQAAQATEDECLQLEQENHKLLEECRNLEEERARREEYIGRLDKEAAESESDLTGQYKDVLSRKQDLHDQIDQQTNDLITSSAVGHHFDLSLGRLKRGHQDALAENAWAKEVLQLERSVENYKALRRQQCQEVQEALAKAQFDDHERMARLLEQWDGQQQKYEADMEAIQAKLSDLQSKYDQRWRVAEYELDQKIAFTHRTAEEVQSKVENHISELDKEREHEAIALQKQIEYQKERLNTAVSQAKAEMNHRFLEVQQQCQDKLDAEHSKCEEQRAVHRLQVRESEREVARWNRHIGKVREAYQQQQDRLSTTPRANRMSPLSLMN